jgi:hypothetical protein
LAPPSGSPQNVYLLPQRQNFRLERCPRPKQIYDHPNNDPDKISHPATASSDSRSTASQIEFATGTGTETDFQAWRDQYAWIAGIAGLIAASACPTIGGPAARLSVGSNALRASRKAGAAALGQ